MNEYIKAWTKYLIDHWGLDDDFAERAAALVVYCSYYKLRPEITSGYRSDKEQAFLIDQAKRGNPNVHTPLPVGKSLHGNTTWWGAPAALAMDMVTSNPAIAGYLAKQLGIVWAGKTDYVHFGARRGVLS